VPLQRLSGDDPALARDEPARGPTVLSGACAFGVDVSSARIGVLIRMACIAPGRIILTAAGTSTIAAAVSSAAIAFAALVTSTASVPAGVSAIAGFCDSKRTLKMRQEGVTAMEMDEHRTKHSDHGSRDQKGRLAARQGRYPTLALTRPRH